MHNGEAGQAGSEPGRGLYNLLSFQGVLPGGAGGGRNHSINRAGVRLFSDLILNNLARLADILPI